VELAVKYARSAAEGHNPRGQFLFGNMLILGHGVPRNLRAGMEYMRRSAGQGFAPAQFRYAKLYCTFGLGDPSWAFEKAARYMEKAANQGDAEAQQRFSIMLQWGVGIDPDATRAALYAQLAADQDPALGLGYAKHLLFGKGVAQNIAQAMEYVRRAAASLGKTMPWKPLALDISDAGLLSEIDETPDFALVIECHIEGAKQRLLVSLVILASYLCRHKLGLHQLKSGRQALTFLLNWFQFEGDPKMVVTQSGEMLSYSSSKDVIFALEKLRIVADNGDAKAQQLIGWCLVTGYGCRCSRRDGLQYFKLAAEQKDPQALLEFGTICRDGRWGASICLSAAIDYLLEAAALGNEKLACNALEELAIALQRQSPIRQWLMSNTTCSPFLTTRYVIAKFGRRALINPRSANVINMFRRLTEGRVALRHWINGWCHEIGFECELNFAHACDCYRQAGDKNLSLGNCDYALFLAHGIGVPQDFRKASFSLVRAAVGGNCEAELAFGRLPGDRGPRSPFGTALWAWNSAALRRYGEYLMKGIDIPMNKEQGGRFLKLAYELSLRDQASDCLWMSPVVEKARTIGTYIEYL
jgi:TPR repeat protein